MGWAGPARSGGREPGKGNSSGKLKAGSFFSLGDSERQNRKMDKATEERGSGHGPLGRAWSARSSGRGQRLSRLARRPSLSLPPALGTVADYRNDGL